MQLKRPEFEGEKSKKEGESHGYQPEFGKESLIKRKVSLCSCSIQKENEDPTKKPWNNLKQITKKY